MKATELSKAIKHIVDTEGDMEVDISLMKQPEAFYPHQEYLVGSAMYVDVDDNGDRKCLSIRDWPY